MEETRQAKLYGVRPARTFEQAAAKFVLENQHKRSISDDERAAEQDSRSFSSLVGIALREWPTSQPKVGKAVSKRGS